MKNKKELEILNLLKNKKINIWLVDYYRSYAQYNDFRQEERKLTEEEFKMIKEWLKNDK